MAPPHRDGTPDGAQHGRMNGVKDASRDDGRPRYNKGDTRDDRKRKHHDTKEYDSSKRRRTQSRSPDRQDERRERERPRERDDRERDRWRDRNLERDQDRKGRDPPTGPRVRPTGPKGGSGRGPRAIPTRQDEEMDIDRPEPRGRPPAPEQGGRKPRVGPLSAPFIPDIHVEEDDDMLLQVKNVMGFAGFKSTNNRKVPGNKHNYAVRKEKQTQYRQYMNRVGGFNRPLSPSRE